MKKTQPTIRVRIPIAHADIREVLTEIEAADGASLQIFLHDALRFYLARPEGVEAAIGYGSEHAKEMQAKMQSSAPVVVAAAPAVVEKPVQEENKPQGALNIDAIWNRAAGISE